MHIHARTHTRAHTHTKATRMFVEVGIFYFGKKGSSVRNKMRGVRLIQGDLIYSSHGKHPSDMMVASPGWMQ